MSKLTLHPNDSTAAGIPSVGGEYVTISTSDLSSSAGSSSAPSSTSDKKARLLYCKSHVSIHPTNFSKDNISGYLGVVEVDTPVTSTVDDEGNVSGGQTEGKELLVTWVPEEVVQRMDERDREGYKRVESWSNQDKGEKEEDGKLSCRNGIADKKASSSFPSRHQKGRNTPSQSPFHSCTVYSYTR